MTTLLRWAVLSPRHTRHWLLRVRVTPIFMTGKLREVSYPGLRG